MAPSSGNIGSIVCGYVNCQLSAKVLSSCLPKIRGGTSGCVVAGRLAENPEVKILLVEAGQHNKDLENVHMTGG